MSRCGTCGDNLPETGYADHDCWVRRKLREVPLPITCPKCGDPMRFATCWKPACVNSAG